MMHEDLRLRVLILLIQRELMELCSHSFANRTPYTSRVNIQEAKKTYGSKEPRRECNISQVEAQLQKPDNVRPQIEQYSIPERLLTSRISNREGENVGMLPQ
ncbi:hypothetical protein YC2023_104393 [Brassica napus]